MAVLGVLLALFAATASGSARENAPPPPANPEHQVASLPPDPRPTEPGLASIPSFAIPAGGTARVSDTAASGQLFRVLDSTGREIARREVDGHGRPVETRFVLPTGDGITIDADYGDPQLRAPANSRVLGRRLSNCGANDQVYSNWYFDYSQSGAFTWYWHQSTTPSYLNLTNTLDSLRNAHSEWIYNQNWCNIADQADALSSYGGTTTRSLGNDGVPIVGWGDTDALGGNCVGSIACTWTWWGSDYHVVDTDTRFSNDTARATWINGGASGKYDVQGTMAHEFGHSLGFDHAPTTDNVMYKDQSTNNMTNRELGRGDANEVNTKY